MGTQGLISKLWCAKALPDPDVPTLVGRTNRCPYGGDLSIILRVVEDLVCRACRKSALLKRVQHGSSV